MRCITVDACLKQISDYCRGNPTGFPLLVNTENPCDYADILNRMEADIAKTRIYVSSACEKDSLPMPENVLYEMKKKGTHVLIGAVQAAMLHGESATDRLLGELVIYQISDHAIVLCDHCQRLLQAIARKNLNFSKRMLFLEGKTSPLPTILIANNRLQCFGQKSMNGMKQLLNALEKNANLPKDIILITKYVPGLFAESMYYVTEVASIYKALCQKYSEIANMTRKLYGTDSQWSWLAEALEKTSSFSKLICKLFESQDMLTIKLADYVMFADVNVRWFYWLALKVYRSTGKSYLAMSLRLTNSQDEFEEKLYYALLEEKHTSDIFDIHYAERKRLLAQLEENLPLMREYCNLVTQYERDAIFYLTDSSEDEQMAIVQCLSKYEYTEKELLVAFEKVAPELASYLSQFDFNKTNTKVAQIDVGIWPLLTQYFQQYKLQKLCNRIFPEFVEQVEELANNRLYNKLVPRSAIVKKMGKNGVQPYFFDALGVEFLSYILAKCEEYGLICEIDVAHGLLPSITAKNKEFEQYFIAGTIRKIGALDELKHHSQVFNYEKVKEPIHLFHELDIIDRNLRMISSELVQEHYQEALILSDHGASRLAVIYEHENEKIRLTKKGEHSGRCCPVAENPNIPFVAYEDGYGILANYERFNGGRPANVEVHGGATLEEVVVPIIRLTKRPEELKIFFLNTLIHIKLKEVATIKLFANPPLKQPKLSVNDIFYDGEFLEDSKHVQFAMPEIKRSRTYEAKIYDGDRKVATLSFKGEKKNAQERQFSL
jgi:hypothetical protein